MQSLWDCDNLSPMVWCRLVVVLPTLGGAALCPCIALAFLMHVMLLVIVRQHCCRQGRSSMALLYTEEAKAWVRLGPLSRVTHPSL